MSAAKPSKIRLDQWLVDSGLVPTRSKARALIMAGKVLVRDKPETKPGTQVASDLDPSLVRLRGAIDGYVSRAGGKLATALDHFSIDVNGALCLDCGISTGGFTDCLLKRGVQAVIGVDVGYGQIDWQLRQDERVHLLEKTNIRHLEAAKLPFSPDFVVIDLSFISITKVLANVVSLCAKPARLVLLVKPQFELERAKVGKGGIVKDEALRQEAVASVQHCGESLGITFAPAIPSAIVGSKGNQEYLLYGSLA